MDFSSVLDQLVDALSELVMHSITGTMIGVKECASAIAQNTNQLIRVAQAAASASTNVELQNNIMSAIDNIAVCMEVMVAEFIKIIQKRREADKDSFAEAAKNVGAALNDLVVLADQISREEVALMVKDASAAAKVLQAAASGVEEEFLYALKSYNEATQSLISLVNNTAETTLVPEKRSALLDALEQLDIRSPVFVEAATVAYEQYNSEETKANLENACVQLLDCYNSMVEVGKMTPASVLIALGESDDSSNYSAKKLGDLEAILVQAVDQLYNASKKGDIEEVIEHAQNTAKASASLVHQAEAIWQRSTDHKQKEELRQLIATVREATDNMIDIAGDVYGQPAKNNAETLHKLDSGRIALLDAVKKLVHTAQRKKPQNTKAPVVTAKTTEEDDANKSAMVRLAKEEAATAMLIADEVEAIAKKISDAQQRKNAMEAIASIRANADKMLHLAKAAAHAPDDVSAQQALAHAQKELAASLRRVAPLYGAGESEFNQAMDAIDLALDSDDVAAGKNTGAGLSKIFECAQRVLDVIGRQFSAAHDISSLGAQQIIQSSREVCATTNELVGEIKKAAKEAKQKEIRQTLGTLSKILNDRAIRIKIISVVKLAAGDDATGGGEEVLMAVKGLEQEIRDNIAVLRAEILRLRMATAVTRSLAMKRVLGLWKARSQRT